MSKELHSSYWLDHEQFKYDAAKFDLVDLLEYRQTIKNFVTILTGKDIPVKFKTTSQSRGSSNPDGSYTDGKSIQIAALRKNSKFDVNVGLALHEASHVVLTDFDISNMFMRVDYNNHMTPEVFHPIIDRLREFRDILSPISSNWHKMTNLFEDVRIDAYVIKNAPGYKGYYDALYDEYLYSDKVKLMLLNPKYREVTIDNYFKHLIVYKRPDRIPNALPGLAEMYDIIDNTDIANMTSTYEVAEFAGNILIKVCEAIDSVSKNQEMPGLGNHEDGKNSNSSPADEADDKNVPQNDNDSESEMDNQSSNSDATDESEDPGSTKEETEANDNDDTSDDAVEEEEQLTELSAKQAKDAAAAMAELEDFINHKVNENGTAGGGNVAKKDALLMNLLDEKARVTKMAKFNNIKCIYVPKLKPADYIGKSPKVRKLFKVGEHNGRYDESIKSGMRAAKLIERNLAIREEERITVHNHLKSGRVDNRRLAYASIVDDIFKKSYIESFPESYIHISVDASSSMQGPRIHAAIEMLVALAKGTENLNSIHLKIDFRGTLNIGGMGAATSIVAYDSKYNSIHDFITYIKHMNLHSITPESLCYESIAKDMIRDAAGKHATFITLTDGAPNMNCGYNCVTAVPHIKKMMDVFRSANIATLAYFIDGNEQNRLKPGYSEHTFYESYGSAAHLIASGDFRKLVSTINSVELSAKVVNVI